MYDAISYKNRTTFSSKTNILWKKLNDYLDIGQECRSTLNCVTVKVYFRENFRPTQCPSF